MQAHKIPSKKYKHVYVKQEQKGEKECIFEIQNVSAATTNVDQKIMEIFNRAKDKK